MIYDLRKGNQFGFEAEEIEADPVLKLAAESAAVSSGSIECNAKNVFEAFEIFFNCTWEDAPGFLPEFTESLLGCLTTHPHQFMPIDGYIIAPVE